MSTETDNLETVNCAVCTADDAETLRTIPPWVYVKCRNCGLVYVNPRLKENAVQEAYEKNRFMAWFKKITYNYRRMADLKNIDERLGRGESFLYEVTRYKQGGRLLDIGCNRGFILANAAAEGWDAYGVEIVPWATALVEREFNVTIFNKRLREIDPSFADRFFDAVTMIDILEHLHEPVKDLREVHRIIKDDGFLLLNTPDIGSACAKIKGYDWMFDKPKEHLYLYDRTTLESMLDKTGFEIITFQQSKGTPGEMEVHAKKTDNKNKYKENIDITNNM